MEPGKPLTIEYGDGKTLEALTLSLRQKRDVAKGMRDIQAIGEKQRLKAIAQAKAKAEGKAIEEDGESGEGLEVFDRIATLVEQCVPNCNGLLDTIDEEDAMSIIAGVLGGNQASEEDKKKSESQPSSADKSSAEAAAETADSTD